MMQENLPGTTPMMTTVPHGKLLNFAIELGQQMAMAQFSEEMRKLQKQHPAAVGITLAIAIADKNGAEMCAVTTRKILTLAAVAGLPIDGHALHSGIENGELVIRSKNDPDADRSE